MVVGENDKAAFFDVNGYRLTEYVYDAFPVVDLKTGVKTYKFGYYDGDGRSELVPFSKDKKYGYINSRGQEIIPAKYEYAYGFVEGMALVCAEGKLSENGFAGDQNKTGDQAGVRGTADPEAYGGNNGFRCGQRGADQPENLLFPLYRRA
jgi:hypothetical protein